MKAEREKNKGNEAFRAGDFDEALVYYSRSLSLLKTVAAHNNRAQSCTCHAQCWKYQIGLVCAVVLKKFCSFDNCFCASSHPIDEATKVLFSGCLSICACMHTCICVYVPACTPGRRHSQLAYHWLLVYVNFNCLQVTRMHSLHTQVLLKLYQHNW